MLIAYSLVIMTIYAFTRALCGRRRGTTTAFLLVTAVAFLTFFLMTQVTGPIPLGPSDLSADAEFLVSLITGGLVAEFAGRTIRSNWTGNRATHLA